MSDKNEVFSAEERDALAIKAVSRLIVDAETKRLLKNKELAEVIAVCIRETGERQFANPQVFAGTARTGTARLVGFDSR
jgi:hypothetical protein